MVRDLPAALGADHRDGDRAVQVFEAAGLPERVDRLVLEQPDLVGGRVVATGRERAHRVERGSVRPDAERADDDRRRHDRGRHRGLPNPAI